MSVNISTNDNISKYDFCINYSDFFQFRSVIAIKLDNEFGEHYKTLLQSLYSEMEIWNKTANDILKKKPDLDQDIIDFLYLADCDGEIKYKVCKKLYDLLKDETQFLIDTYDEDVSEEFKKFLLYCYKHKKKMVWC